MTERGLDRWGSCHGQLEQWAEEVLVVWPQAVLAGRRGRPVDGLAWPGRQDKTAAGKRSIFRALDGWKLELARCDWSMYGASAQTRCPLPSTHCTRFLIVPAACPAWRAYKWYCRRREHSVACHTPDLCGCQSFSPSISNVAKTPSGRQGGIEQRRCGHSYQPCLWQWLPAKFFSDFLLSTLLECLKALAHSLCC